MAGLPGGAVAVFATKAPYKAAHRKERETAPMSALTLFEHPAPPAPRIRDGGVLATRLAGKHGALITGHFVLPGREGRFAELPDDLPPALAAALRSRGGWRPRPRAGARRAG